MLTTFSIPPILSKDFPDRIRIAARLMGFKLTECLEITFYSKNQPPIAMDNIFINALRHDGYEMEYCVNRWIESQDEKIVVETSGVECLTDRFVNQFLK